MSQYLFAYGTLQPGLRARGRLRALAAKMRPVGEGFVRGVLYDLGGYPGAVADARAASNISGTVMELLTDMSVLRQLDDYEGFDPQAPETSEYVRERQMVEMSDGRKVECWFYRYNGELDGVRAIASGVWEQITAGQRIRVRKEGYVSTERPKEQSEQEKLAPMVRKVHSPSSPARFFIASMQNAMWASRSTPSSCRALHDVFAVDAAGKGFVLHLLLHAGHFHVGD